MKKIINLCYSVIIGVGLVTAALIWQAATPSHVIEFPPLPDNAQIVGKSMGICNADLVVFIIAYAVGEEVFRIDTISQADELLIAQLYDKAGDLIGLWVKTRTGIRHYSTIEEVKKDFESPCDVYTKLHPRENV